MFQPMETKNKPAPFDDFRAGLLAEIKAQGLTMKGLSLDYGGHQGYLQQFIMYGTPRTLPDDWRHFLAKELNKNPRDFMTPEQLKMRAGDDAGAENGGHYSGDIQKTADANAIALLLECYAKIVLEGAPLAGTPVMPLALGVVDAIERDTEGVETKEDRFNRISLSLRQALLGTATTKIELPDHLRDRMERAVRHLLTALPLAAY